MLVTTDVLARGLDLPQLKTVINFDFPNSLVDYIHRVGRTGRAGKQGRAITFFSPQDQVMLREVAEMLHRSGVAVPEWILDMRPGDKRQVKRIGRYGVEREDLVYDRNSKAGQRRFDEFKGFVKRQDYLFKKSKEVLGKRGAHEAPGPEIDLAEAEHEFVELTPEQMQMMGIVIETGGADGGVATEDTQPEAPTQESVPEQAIHEPVGQVPKKAKKTKPRKTRVVLTSGKGRSPQSILSQKNPPSTKRVKRDN